MVGIRLKRKMSQNERDLATAVFYETLPWDRIEISNTIGAGNRQYVTPELKYGGGWVMHLGPAMYGGTTITKDSDTFMHELTHVWQSFHNPLKWGYVADSMCQQILLMKGSKAYDYQPGSPWNSYHAEQQAQIVMHWYLGGVREDDVLFPYIRDHIRRGIN
jgi:hypothetical protein